MSISSSLFNSLQNTGKNSAAGERAALLSSAPNSESSTSFSQMLRETSKPIAPPPPAPPPPPASAAAPQHDGEIKPERQRQEAKAALKRSDSPKPAAVAPKPVEPAPTAPTDAADDNTTVAGAADDAPDAPVDKKHDPIDDVRFIADPKLAPDAAAPVPMTGAGPQILALLAKAGLAPEGGTVKTDTAGDSPTEERPALRANTNTRSSARTDTGAALGRAAAAEVQPTTELAARDFAAELLNAGSALPQAFQAIKGSGPAREGASIDGLLSASAANPTAVNQAAAPDTPTITLAQPLYEPGFAPELAARVSLLAADGVQEAQLHLNPAEMGPVAVQIVLDGQQAQVSFHAEQADTRAVLEQSMPDLAAALREAGLTLSGGGVFQQMRDPSAGSQGQTGEANDRRSARVSGSRADDSLQATSRTTPAPRATRGVVDLYA